MPIQAKLACGLPGVDGDFKIVELATLEWIGWFNNRRLLEIIGYITPAEAQASYHASLEPRPIAA